MQIHIRRRNPICAYSRFCRVRVRRQRSRKGPHAECRPPGSMASRSISNLHLGNGARSMARTFAAQQRVILALVKTAKGGK